MDDKTQNLALSLMRARLRHALLVERRKSRLIKIAFTRPLTKEESAVYDFLREDGKQVGFKELAEMCKQAKTETPLGLEGWDDD